MTGLEIIPAYSVRLHSDFHQTTKGSNFLKLPLLTKCGLCASVSWKFHLFWRRNGWRQSVDSVDISVHKEKRSNSVICKNCMQCFQGHGRSKSSDKDIWSLITVSDISICVSVLFFFFFYFMSFLYTCFAKQKKTCLSEAVIIVCPWCCHSNHRTAETVPSTHWYKHTTFI